MNSKRLNVVYSSDDNYAQHLGASLYSLLQHNTEYKYIYVYIIDNIISSENKSRLQMIADAFTNAKVVFISFDKWSSLLNLNMMWPISLSAYARLFLGSIIEETVERILYLDCDTIVCDSLTELWETDLDKNIIAAVQDTVNEQTKNGV